MELPVVQLKALHHKGALRIGLFFQVNHIIQTELKKESSIRFSITHKCWHMPYQLEAYNKMMEVLKPIARVDTEQLKKYQEEKFSLNALNVTTKKLVAKIQTEKQDSSVGQQKNRIIGQIAQANQQHLLLTKQRLELKAYSSSTIRTYLNELSTFFRLLAEVDAADMTVQRVKDYLTYCMITLQLTENTIHSRLNALKFFYEQVLGREKFFINIPRPKKHLQLPKVLGETELRRLFAAPQNIKHKAILFLGYSAGLRVSEVINLRLQDIDRERKQLFIHCSKGKKDRYVNLSILVLDVLEQYYKLCKIKPVNYLFEGTEAGKPYTTRSAQQIFSDAKEKAGISKTLSFHSLRHSFATHLLEKGVDAVYIKDILGHFNIKTTERYLHVRKEFLINIPSPIDDLYS